MNAVTPIVAAHDAPAPFVTVINGRLFTDSRNVASMFGKRHDNVMRDIRGLLSFEETPSPREMFVESTYVDPQNGRVYDCYLMDRDGFALLAMAFTGPRALRWKLAYSAAFNSMERQLRERAPAPVVLPEILRDPATIIALIEHQARETLAARAEAEAERVAHGETHAHWEDEVRLRRIESARAESNGRALVVVTEQVRELAPLAEGYRRVLDANGAICVTDAANVLGVPRGRLYAFMRDKGTEDAPREPWLYVRPGQEQEHAYRSRIHRDELRHRLVHLERSGGKLEIKPQPLVTMKGIDRLRVEYPLWAAEQERKAELQARLPGVA
ncbi:hypothetical protein ASG63_16425 [Methylobacterium sp. Leaf94]|uniref:phage regulatory protein/antirepressor Ant n=1 Tax=Methylobacterium sp. Leaf94 TaxID=1736250 RepID=UPI0006F75E65|nr:phage regulatory protein/antirepressor Ant [Methylobacterium sp. Leaf94]KQU31084.1 hypothetical protein ASG63_16425 [Methylobacterium sp. Leaf94]